MYKVKHSGISLIEVVVGVSLATLILLFTMHTIARFVNVGRDVSNQTQALYMAEDGVELVRFWRDEDWTNISGLTDGTDYYLSVGVGSVSLAGSLETLDNSRFRRWFEVQPVYRNSDDDVVDASAPGATADTNSKYLTVYVAFDSPTSTVSVTTLIADIHE